MSRKYKTSKKNRTTYIYYGPNGQKIMELIPGENGVTEALVEELHAMDDTDVNEQRRYDYRVTEHLDAYHDGDGEEAGDRNKRLADNRANPETVLIAQEDDTAYAETLFRLSNAMESLELQQRTLFEKKYVSKRSNTDIAAEEGVSETVIRKRLRKMHDKLRKFFP
ncbi:MAG: sigma-70 family RNA polymerase sigma factor [Clostridium sp.]|nr:sigma-70 family RNA polymerase sigma factor [Clostridium sp.]